VSGGDARFVAATAAAQASNTPITIRTIFIYQNSRAMCLKVGSFGGLFLRHINFVGRNEVPP
jgi:hypothetical protein